MKRILWVIPVCLLLLTGCGRETAEATEAVPADTVLVSVADVTESIGYAVYDIVPEDRSLRNENGSILVESVYEKLVLQGAAPEIASINEMIAADCDRFFAESGAVSYYEPETLEQMIRDMGLDYGDLVHNACVTVTHNQDHLLSLDIRTDWYLGGVFQADFYGMTFDLRTGERVSLAQLSELPEEEWEARLKENAGRWLRESCGEGLLAAPEEILAEYTLEDLRFYVREGEIILAFPAYTFAAGAAGAAVIPTGLFIETAK